MSPTGTPRNHRRTIALIVTFLSLPLFVLACCSSEAVKARTISLKGGLPPLETISGSTALCMGWFPPYTLAWFGNILLLVALILLWVGWTRAAFIWSSLAVLSSLTTLLFVALGRVELLDGYYLWQASFLVVAIGAWMASNRKQSDLAEARGTASTNPASSKDTDNAIREGEPPIIPRSEHRAGK